MKDTAKNTAPIVKGLLGFLITFSVLTGLLTTQFIWKFKDDIFGKNIDSFTLTETFFFSALSMSPLVLPLSILVMTIIYSREQFKDSNFKINLGKLSIIACVLSICSFIWFGFINPAINLRHSALIFDLKMKDINSPLTRTDINIFNGMPITSNLFQINHYSDSISDHITIKKKEIIEFLTANVNENSLNDLLKEESAILVGLQKPNTPLPENNSFDLPTDYFKNHLIVAADEIRNRENHILKFQIEKAKYLGMPFSIFILFFLGVSLGKLNTTNNLLILSAGIFFTIIPGYYYLALYFDNLIKSNSLTPFSGHISINSILIVLTIGLWIYSNKRDKTTSANICICVSGGLGGLQ